MFFEFHSRGARRRASRPNPSAWRPAFSISSLQIIHLLSAVKNITNKREDRPLTHPTKSILFSTRPRSWKPSAAGRAFTGFFPSSTFRVGTRRVSTIAELWAPPLIGEKTWNYFHALSSRSVASPTPSLWDFSSACVNPSPNARLRPPATQADVTAPDRPRRRTPRDLSEPEHPIEISPPDATMEHTH